MLTQRSLRSTFRIAAVLSVLAFAASCDSDSTGPDDEDEPEVTQMRITFGAQSFTFTGAQGEARAVRVPVGTTAVSVQWLRADGTVDPIAVTPTFTLRVTGANGVTFTNSAAQSFSGTLTAPAVTNAPVQFELLHVAENHPDFGPLTINISAP